MSKPVSGQNILTSTIAMAGDGSVRPYLYAFLAALLLIALQVYTKPEKAPVLDEFNYLTIAADMLNNGGIFTNGRFTAERSQQKPGRFVSPLYPAFLYGMARLDNNVAKAIKCWGNLQGQKACPGNFRTVVAIQVLLAAISLVFIFAIGNMLSGSVLVAWLTMIIAFSCEQFGYYARTYLTENFSYFWMYALLFFLLLSWLHKRPVYFLIAGLCAGAAALSRPSYIYLFYAIAPALFLLLIATRRFNIMSVLRLSGAFVLGAVLLIGPWMIRNYIHFGDPALNHGYGQFILFQRIAYNLMSWQEWGVFLVYSLPDFGDKLSQSIFPKELWWRLPSFRDDVETFYEIGNSPAWQASIMPANIPQNAQLGYLLKTYVFGDLFKHVMVTIPLAMRGMWVGNYIALAGVIFAWPVMMGLKQKDKLIPFLLIALPPLFMVGLHAFVSVSVVRYNVPMIAVYAVVCAIFIRELLNLSSPTAAFARKLENTLLPH